MERRIGVLVEKEIFSPIDAYFAKTLGKQDSSWEVLIGYLLAMARQGHLCVQIKDNKINPPPSILTEDRKDTYDANIPK